MTMGWGDHSSFNKQEAMKLIVKCEKEEFSGRKLLFSKDRAVMVSILEDEVEIDFELGSEYEFSLTKIRQRQISE